MMNMATGARITLNETFEILRELTGYSGKPAYAPARSGDIRDSLADIRLAGELLGYQPHGGFPRGAAPHRGVVQSRRRRRLNPGDWRTFPQRVLFSDGIH